MLLYGFLDPNFKEDVSYDMNWKDGPMMCEPNLVRLLEDYEPWLQQIGLGGTSLQVIAKALHLLDDYFEKSSDP